MPDVLSILTNLSTATPMPTTWFAALAPLLRRAEVARLGLLAAKAEHTTLMEQIAALDLARLSTRVMPSEFTRIARLVTTARQVLSFLDGDFLDLQLLARGAVGVKTENELARTLERLERFVKLAEAVLEAIHDGVREIGKTFKALAITPFVSETFIAPPRPQGGFIAEVMPRG